LTRKSVDAAPALRDLLINDLEPAARRLCPPVARIAERLERVGAIAVSMTGSGATVLGAFRSGREASEAETRLRAEDRSAEEPCWIQATRILSTGQEATGQEATGREE
jgi:4-diphosphocytidyl-2C-methyl-D-erythritol kinase